VGLESEFFVSMGWIIVAAAVCGLLARFVKLPPIVAYLLAGLLLGPVLGVVTPSEGLRTLSEVGIVLLLFLVGLELSFDKIRDVGKVAVAAGLGQVIFTAAGGFGICWFLGFSVMDAVFLAVALTFSSTVVVVKILTDKNELDSLYGRIAVGIFLVQDIVVIVVLTVLTGLQTGGGEGGVWDLVWGVGRAFGGMFLLLGGVLLSSRFLLPRPFAWVAGSPGTLFIWSLGWCFAVVALAYKLGLSVELGAFFAGVSLAQLPYNRDLQHRIKPLMNFFVAVFFATLGMGMTPGSAVAEWFPIAVLSLFVIIGNPFIFLLIISRMGFGERTAFFTSVTVAQISEFSFIFVAMGAASGLIGERVIAITAMVGLITIAASAYMILYNRPLYDWVKKLGVLAIFRARGEDAEEAGSLRSGHVIVVGMNSLGRRLAVELHKRGESVLAIDTDARKLRNLPCETLLGSTEFLDVLLDAGLPDAKLVISALRIEEANELIAYRCRQFDVPSSILAADLSMVDNLMELGVQYLMLPKVDGVKLQTRWLREEGFLPQ
jgi:Kef-type K+ transport system membrane component KefB